MGCDIHIIIQVLDLITNEFKFVRESVNTSQKIRISEHLTFVIYSDESNEKLILMSSDELKDNLIKHADCQIDECDCQIDFNLEFHVKRDYRLSAKIANVRSYGESEENMESRGLPDDASDILKHIFYEAQDDIPLCECIDTGNLHSHTYLYDYEIENLNIENSQGLTELKRLLTRVKDNFSGVESRFIIAFDN